MPQAVVFWEQLRRDILYLAVGSICIVVGFAIDYRTIHSDWFPRSGAVGAFLGALVAYRSISKQLIKTDRDWQYGEHLSTSANQLKVDRWAFLLSSIGTFVWAFGDKFL
jgi:hypothetical protein